MTCKRIINALGRCAVLLTVVGMLGYTAVGYAQVVPGAADATRFPGEVEKRNAPLGGPAHAPAATAEEPVPPQAVPADAAKLTFVLNEIQLTGVSAYNADIFKPLWAGDLGKTVSLKHMYEIAAAITTKYRQDGFLLSRAFIPGQTIQDGIVKISVVEGYVRQVRFEGDIPSSYVLAQARTYILKDRPLRTSTLERQMLLLNDMPGTDFHAVLKPIPDVIAGRDLQDTSGGGVRQLPHVLEKPVTVVKVLDGARKNAEGKTEHWRKTIIRIGEGPDAGEPAERSAPKAAGAAPVITRHVEKAETKAATKHVERAETKAEEKPVEKAETKAEQKPVEKAETKAEQKHVETAATKAEEKPAAKPAVKKKHVERAETMAVEKPAVKTAAAPAKGHAVTAAAKGANKAVHPKLAKAAQERARQYTYPPDMQLGKTQSAKESCHCDTALDVTAYIAVQKDVRPGSHGKVLFIASDDSTADAVARDLVTAGAPLERFTVVPSPKPLGIWDYVRRKSKLDHDLDAVRELVKKNKNAELIVLDPIEAYFSDLKQGTRNIREVVSPLAKIAVKNHTPILVVSRAPAPLPGAPRITIPPQQKSIVLPEEPFHDGGVMLVIQGTPRRAWQGQVTVDNAESRFLGPWLVGTRFSLLREPIPYGRTDFAFNFTPGNKELRFGQVSQSIPLSAEGVNLTVSGSYTKGRPGFSLTPDRIVSTTWTSDTMVDWVPLRRRLENLRLSAGFSTIDAHTTALGLPLSEDHTRAAKLQGHFDEQDALQGSSTVDVTLARGLLIGGASDPNSPLLSRATGRPDFLTITGQAYRYQRLSSIWEAVLGVSGQAATSALLSEQQFGFGGQAFGRAYDPSEIVGDAGLAGTVELRYDGFRKRGNGLQPFSFYDLGTVWNRGIGQPPQQSGASAGAGFRFDLPWGANTSFLVAQPLTLRESDPQFGNTRSKRYVFSFTQPM